VGEECRAARERVGLLEIANFAKYEVSGPGTAEFLSRVLAGRMPEVGRMALNPMLNERGKLIGDFTLWRLGPDEFRLFGSGAAEEYHLRWFERQGSEKIRLRSLRNELLGWSISGPRARELLQSLVREDVSNEAFPFLSFRKLAVGMAPALVGRISFTGELGYEIWVTADWHLALYDALMEAGAPLGLKLFGSRALLSLRLEKSFGNWAREFRPIYGPYEAGLGRFLALKKGDFVGRAAALAERDAGPKLRLAAFAVDDQGVDAIGDEPIWYGGRVVGWVTSGGYGHVVGKSIVLGYIERALGETRDGFEVEILGTRCPARLSAAPLWDPEGKRMRS
jgi:dimethylglycine dehydrogenase